MAGTPTADDGTLGRSAGVHAGRAAVLIVAAVVIGLLVLNDSGPTTVSTSGPEPDRITVPEQTTSTTAARAPTTTTAALRPAEQVKVIALNATSTAGVAGKISAQLRDARYNVLAAGNATATAKAAARASFVYYTPGYTREALLVAQTLGVAPTNVQALPAPPPGTDLKGANVVVLVKEDLANKPAASSTTTTRRP